jgi:hypothetical protein
VVSGWLSYTLCTNVHASATTQKSVMKKPLSKLYIMLNTLQMKGYFFGPIVLKGFNVMLMLILLLVALDCEETSSVYSCTGYVIMFAGCPVIWVSKLQTEVALSMTEVKYTGSLVVLSQIPKRYLPIFMKA